MFAHVMSLGILGWIECNKLNRLFSLFQGSLPPTTETDHLYIDGGKYVQMDVNEIMFSTLIPSSLEVSCGRSEGEGRWW